MGLGSHTQTNDQLIAPAYPLGTAGEDACTGRAAGSTGNLSRSALLPFEGVA